MAEYVAHTLALSVDMSLSHIHILEARLKGNGVVVYVAGLRVTTMEKFLSQTRIPQVTSLGLALVAYVDPALAF